MIITICSSIDFTPKILEIKDELEKKGHQVNIPYATQRMLDGHLSYEEFIAQKEKNGDIFFREAQGIDMIKRYWNFIGSSDAILVLNLEKRGIENYIGGNTLMEMGFAYGHGTRIFLLNSVPQRSERMHYVDEILDMKPVIINGDLDKMV